MMVADATDGRTLWRGARRLRHLLRSGRPARRRRNPSPKAARRGNGWRISTSRPARRSRSRVSRRRVSTILGARPPDHAAQPDDGGTLRRFRDDPVARRAADTERPHRDLLGHHRRLSAMPIAPAIPPGWRRPSAGAWRAAFWSPTSRRRGCTASSISADISRPQASRARGRAHPPARCRARVGSRMATWSACSTPAAPVSRGCASPSRHAGRRAAADRRLVRPGDPEDARPLCVHGNPNVLTRDVGTSSPRAGLHRPVDDGRVERFNGNLPPIRAFDPV